MLIWKKNSWYFFNVIFFFIPLRLSNSRDKCKNLCFLNLIVYPPNKGYLGFELVAKKLPRLYSDSLNRWNKCVRYTDVRLGNKKFHALRVIKKVSSYPRADQHSTSDVTSRKFHWESAIYFHFEINLSGLANLFVHPAHCFTSQPDLNLPTRPPRRRNISLIRTIISPFRPQSGYFPAPLSYIYYLWEAGNEFKEVKLIYKKRSKYFSKELDWGLFY